MCQTACASRSRRHTGSSSRPSDRLCTRRCRGRSRLDTARYLHTPLSFIELFNETIRRLPERFASAWPELIIACDVRGRGEWLHRCSWLPLQLACAAYRLFAHAFNAFWLQTDRRTGITTGLHIAPFAFTGGDAKKRKQLSRSYIFNSCYIMALPVNFIFGMEIHLQKYLGRIRVSRSQDQGQGHGSAKW